jgi:hypothetical protein
MANNRGFREPRFEWWTKKREQRQKTVKRSSMLNVREKSIGAEPKSVVRDRANAFEAEVAALLGGARTPASGAGGLKGDATVETFFQVEAKSTQEQRYTVTSKPQGVLTKLFNEADAAELVPVLAVRLEADTSHRTDLVVLRLEDFAVITASATRAVVTPRTA